MKNKYSDEEFHEDWERVKMHLKGVEKSNLRTGVKSEIVSFCFGVALGIIIPAMPYLGLILFATYLFIMYVQGRVEADKVVKW